MEAQGFGVAWGWYLAALLMAVWVMWRGGKFLPLVSAEHTALAPAWLVAMFDGLVQEDGSFWRAGKMVVFAGLLGVLPALAVAYIERRRGAAPVESA